MSLITARPEVTLRNAPEGPFDGAIAAARTCYSQREAWGLEGLNYLHHPRRAAVSEEYIPRSLALLREIQRTGDIFFPKRWMDATLGGHSSAASARMVSRFLAQLPQDYPDRLRRVILSSSDNVFRASGAERYVIRVP